MDGMSKSKVYPCRVCILRVKVDSALCVQCGKCSNMWSTAQKYKKISMDLMSM